MKSISGVSPDGPDQGEVCLYFADQDHFSQKTLEAECLGWLSVTQRSRYHRLLLAEHRKGYLLGQALIRLALSQRTGVDPARWRFATGRYGKPVIKLPRLARACHFNLSHSGTLSVVALSDRAALGVDIENNTRQRLLTRIARRHFSEEEASALLALPPAAQRSRFYTLWTLKEAYTKARGTGLAVSLQRFGFDFLPPPQSGFGFWVDESLRDDAADWQFWQSQALPGYHLALAVGGARQRPVHRVSACRFDTLHHHHAFALPVLRSSPKANYGLR